MSSSLSNDAGNKPLVSKCRLPTNAKVLVRRKTEVALGVLERLLGALDDA